MDGEPPVVLSVDRVAARVLVIDESGAVLLLEGQDSTRPDAPTWWFTPGGGVDPGESLHAAATRELLEETGLAAVIDGPPVHARDTEFDFEAVHYVQHEEFFVLRTKRFVPLPHGWSEMEQRSMVGYRWWTAGELAATDAVVYPEALAELVRRVAGQR